VKKVYCITDLGCSFQAFILHENLNMNKEYRDYFKNYSGEDRYALVFDPEYGSFDLKRWGFDCFSEEQWLEKHGRLPNENIKFTINNYIIPETEMEFSEVKSLVLKLKPLVSPFK
jgi:hypothetical protein